PWERAHPGIHFFFILHEIAKGGVAEDLVDCHLHCAPERPDGAIDGAGANRNLSRVVIAEAALEEAPAKGGDDVADYDLAGRTRQCIAAFLAARRFDEASFAERAENLRTISKRKSFHMTDFRDS